MIPLNKGTMMTLPAYAPKTISFTPRDKYEDRVADYGPAPKGYRWHKVGDTQTDKTIFANKFDNTWKISRCVGDKVVDSHFAACYPIPAKKIPVSRLESKIASLEGQIAALDKKVYAMTAETNKLVAEQRQRSEELKTLRAAAEILNKKA